MKKSKIYDSLIIILLYIGLSCFPLDLFDLPNNTIIIFQIVLQVLIFVFLLLFDKKSSVKIQIYHGKKSNILLFLPAFAICFSNFFCLINPINSFEISSDPSVILSVILTLCVVINEELIFRSILLSNFLQDKDPLFRITISSIIFAACHLTHFLSSFNPVDLVIVAYTFGIGFVLGLMYLYTNSIILCVIFHFCFNLVNGIISTHFLNLKVDETYFLINGSIAVIFIVYFSIIYRFILRKKLEFNHEKD